MKSRGKSRAEEEEETCPASSRVASRRVARCRAALLSSKRCWLQLQLQLLQLQLLQLLQLQPRVCLLQCRLASPLRAPKVIACLPACLPASAAPGIGDATPLGSGLEDTTGGAGWSGAGRQGEGHES